MSEKQAHHSIERPKAPETQDVRERLDKLGEKLARQGEEASSEHNPESEKEEARKSVEKHAHVSAEHEPMNKENAPQKEPVTRGYKKMTYRSTMKRVEAKLPSYQRTFSRIINNDAIDAVSAVSAKTIARPSGILGSSIAAFLGLAAITFYANRLGFTVSPAFFIVLLIAGWLLGLAVEFGYAALRKLLKR